MISTKKQMTRTFHTYFLETKPHNSNTKSHSNRSISSRSLKPKRISVVGVTTEINIRFITTVSTKLAAINARHKLGLYFSMQKGETGKTTSQKGKENVTRTSQKSDLEFFSPFRTNPSDRREEKQEAKPNSRHFQTPVNHRNQRKRDKKHKMLT